MNTFIIVLILLLIFVLVFLLLRKKIPSPTTTTTTQSPVSTTTLPPLVAKCYNIKIPINILNNGTDDLWIDYVNYNGNFVTHPYFTFDDCGLYQPDAICINICSLVDPTYKFGINGDHVIADLIVQTINGDCIDGICDELPITTVLPTTTKYLTI